jgi:1,4-alpha-glucan branching enzyme
MRLTNTLFTILTFITSTTFTHAQEKSVSHPEWAKNLVIYETNIRQYSPEGTFSAFEKYLPELKKMGVGIIWLMPIQPIGEKNRKGTLGSYYSISDHKSVNPEFGTPDEFRSLVNKAHQLGMYVIIDWVANHTSWDHVWTKTNPEYFTKDSANNFVSPVSDWTDVIDLNYDNYELRLAMKEALLYWVKEYNIDGYRCDVAAMVPTDFWNLVRKELDTIKPVFMLAEAHDTFLHEEAFDMTYSWGLRELMLDIFRKKKNADDLHNYLLKEEYSKYNPDAYRMVFLTNHDENSWEGTVNELFGNSGEMFTVFSSVFYGVNLIYSGQEAGLDKRLPFFEKDSIEWKDHELRGIYTQLNNLKKQNQALWNGKSGGKLNRISTNESKTFYCFTREMNGDKIVGLFNFSGQSKAVNINDDALAGNYRNVFTNETVTMSRIKTVELPAWGYRVFINE